MDSSKAYERGYISYTGQVILGTVRENLKVYDEITIRVQGNNDRNLVSKNKLQTIFSSRPAFLQAREIFYFESLPFYATYADT